MTSQLGKVSHTFAHMPQDDPQTRRLIHFGRQAARSSFPVLLCGEEGVGKALLSQAIHNESDAVLQVLISPSIVSYMVMRHWRKNLLVAIARTMKMAV